MSVNQFTYSNSSHLPPQPSSISSFIPLQLYCFIPKPGCTIFNAFTIINILVLLPLCSLILHHGFQQWRKRRPSSSSTSTHSDTFTYHLVTMELIQVFGCIICVCGIYTNLLQMLFLWAYFFSISTYGEGIFHILTCVEHYLAVVHPITYLSLRGAKWIRVRNIIIGCIWLLCLALTCVLLSGNNYLKLYSCLSIVSVIMISFCSLSVLQALIHPGPWEQGKDRVRIHQSKKKAFYTIVAILAVLLLRCVYILFWSLHSVLDTSINDCMLSIIVVWIYLPGSLVIPLLYLHRRGMLVCQSHSRK